MEAGRGQQGVGRPVFTLEAQLHEGEGPQSAEAGAMGHGCDDLQEVAAAQIGMQPSPPLGIPMPVDAGSCTACSFERPGPVARIDHSAEMFGGRRDELPRREGARAARRAARW